MSYSRIIKYKRMRTELEKELSIDKDDLDNELIKQPQLTYTVGSNHSKVTKNRMEAEEALVYYENKYLTATQGAAYMETKKSLTSSDRKERLMVQSERKELIKDVIAWRLEESQWKALLEGIGQKGYSIKNLTELFTASYWASTSRR